MNKIDRYLELASRFGYTPEQIANMTPVIQFVMLGLGNVKDTITFKRFEDYQKFRAGLLK